MSTVTKYHRPVCVKCKTELLPESNDGVVVDMFGEPQRPYRLIYVDIYKCPTCGIEIAVGFGDHAFSEHFHVDFQEEFARVVSNGKPLVENFETRHRPIPALAPEQDEEKFYPNCLEHDWAPWEPYANRNGQITGESRTCKYCGAGEERNRKDTGQDQYTCTLCQFQGWFQRDLRQIQCGGCKKTIVLFRKPDDLPFNHFGDTDLCIRCAGKGYFMIGSDECKCPNCNGTGMRG